MKTTVKSLNGDQIIVDAMKFSREIVLKVKNALGQEISTFLTLDQLGALLFGLEQSGHEIEKLGARETAPMFEGRAVA